MTANSAVTGVRKYLLSRPVNFTAPTVLGLGDRDQDFLKRLVEVWRVKQPRNRLRQAYLDGLVRPENLGIAVPDDMVDLLGVVVGWPRKVVFGLADLIMWDGVTGDDGAENPGGLRELLDDNNFGQEVGQAIASALTQSLAFLTLRRGEPSEGEPAVVIQAHSAEWASGLWDRLHRRLAAGLTVNDVDDLGRPTRMTLFTPDETLVLADSRRGPWAVLARDSHGASAPMMEALPFEPSLDRPLGRSRISRDVMSITQRAMRTVLREELALELFTVPGLLLRGVDEATFAALKDWSWKLGTVKGLSRDEDGLVPEVDFLPQQTAQPFTDQMRALATEMAGVSSLPVSSFGVVQDNPSSAEALYAAKEELIIKARNATKVFDAPLSRLYRAAAALAGADFGPVEAGGARPPRISTRWGDPAHPSIVSQSDAIVKQITALPWLADTTVVLEELGYSDSQITRLLSDKRRAEASGFLDRLTRTLPQREDEERDDGEDETEDVREDEDEDADARDAEPVLGSRRPRR